MKTFCILVAGLLFASCSRGNLPDSADRNITPAPQEQRENEMYNSPDIIDENQVPAREEERARDEEMNYDN